MNDSIFGETIYMYTREQALEDGVLVDVTETAKEAGFNCPVAMTDAAFAQFVTWNNDTEKTYQDESGRLWDVVSMLMYAVRARKESGSHIMFKFLSIPPGKTKAKGCTLKSIAGPGDSGELVITIMLPHED